MAKLGDINSQTDVATSFIQSAQLTGTTNATGDISGTYPTPFTTYPILLGQVAGQSVLMSCTVFAISASGFTFRCFGATGAALGPQAITINWIAVGTKP